MSENKLVKKIWNGSPQRPRQNGYRTANKKKKLRRKELVQYKIKIKTVMINIQKQIVKEDSKL